MSSNDINQYDNYQKMVDVQTENGYEKTIIGIANDGYQIVVRLYGEGARKARNPLFLYPIYAEVYIRSDVSKQERAWIITRGEKRKNFFNPWRKTIRISPHQRLADNFLDAFTCIKEWYKRNLNQEGLDLLRNVFNDIYTDIDTHQSNHEGVNVSKKHNQTPATVSPQGTTITTH